MVRRVVFAGGAQARALARIYRGELASGNGDTVGYVAADTLMRETAKRAMAGAEMLVLETGDDGDCIAARLLPANIPVIRMPTVQADFLWPYAGRPHPRNATGLPMPDGPFPAEHGDSFLDRMMEEGVPEDEAVARYLAHDIAAEADLDGRLSRRLAMQAETDARTGHDLASFIESRFQSGYLFASRERPRLPLFRRVASVIFEKLGLGEEAGLSLRQVPNLAAAQPIHPGVIAHFGLSTPDASYRYAMQDEGLFTFEEYCHRYLRFVTNEKLHRGIALAKTKPEEAIPLLRDGLALSPLSRGGKRALRIANFAVRGGARPPADEGVPADDQNAGDSLEEDALEADTADSAEAEPIVATEQAPAPIENLPSLAHHGEGLTATLDRPFSAMPEIMPPPPMRPDLPPEPEPEEAAPPPAKASLFGKLSGMFKGR